MEELRTLLGDSASVSVEEADRKAATKDFSWVSPIIQANIPRTLPDAVVTVRSVEAVQALARYAHARRIPLTARGRGTLNYGQIIPLARGMMVDFHELAGEVVLDDDGVITALPGTTWRDVMAFLDGSGRELAMFPTTLNSTLAGYVGGGAGGPGSIEHGFNHEGFVRSLTLVPVTAEAELVEVTFPDTTPHVHAFGTTGADRAGRPADGPGARAKRGVRLRPGPRRGCGDGARGPAAEAAAADPRGHRTRAGGALPGGPPGSNRTGRTCARSSPSSRRTRCGRSWRAAGAA